MTFVQTISDLFLELLFHRLARQHFCQLVLQFIQDGGDLIVGWLVRVFAALQDEPLHSDQPDSRILVMNIFQCVDPARLHDDLF